MLNIQQTIRLKIEHIIKLGLLICFLITLLPSDSWGQKPIWISPSVANNQFSLSTFENELGVIPTSDLSLGVSFGVDPIDHLSISLTYNRMFSNHDAYLQMVATLWMVDLDYLHPVSSKISMGLGGGFGLISVSGSTSNISFPMIEPMPFYANGANGRDFAIHGFGSIRWRLSSKLALTPQLGYRWSRIEELESNSGRPLVILDNQPVEADYSGWFFEIGARLYPFD